MARFKVTVLQMRAKDQGVADLICPITEQFFCRDLKHDPAESVLERVAANNLCSAEVLRMAGKMSSLKAIARTSAYASIERPDHPRRDDLAIARDLLRCRRGRRAVLSVLLSRRVASLQRKSILAPAVEKEPPHFSFHPSPDLNGPRHWLPKMAPSRPAERGPKRGSSQ